MNGVSPVSIVRGSAYTDAGATATDNVDPVVLVSAVSTVNTGVIGTYTITYTARDAANNPAIPVVRTVNVVAASPKGTATVKFVVTDSYGRPLLHAEVSMNGKEIETINGNAIFTNVTLGTYEYEIEKDGYHEIKGRITVAGDTTIALKLVNERHRRTDSSRYHD
jgi:uncharacterized membrane protein